MLRHPHGKLADPRLSCSVFVRSKRGSYARLSIAAAVVIALVAACGSTPPAPSAPTSATPVATPAPSASTSAAGRVPGATTPGSLPPVISRGPATAKRIALTFDSNMTDRMLAKLDRNPRISYANTRVLDELDRAQAPATFFLASLWVQRYPAVTRRIAADPRFEIASHSYAHHGFTKTCYDLGSLPVDQMAADVERSFDVLKPYGGKQTRYFRFPGGCFDKAALRAIAPAGCTVVQYSDVAGDPFNHDVRSIENNVLSKATPGGIVVMHITEANAPETHKALPAIIAKLRQRGYELVTLSQLLNQ